MQPRLSRHCPLLAQVLALALSVVVDTASGATITVPGQAGSLEAAIAATGAGDTILVGPGTYRGPENRKVWVESDRAIIATHGPQQTIVDCESVEEGFAFFPGVTSESCLDGFTIQNARYYGQGSAVYLLGASPVIRNCIITENVGYGAPLYITSGGQPEILGCVFSNNVSTYFGGGIFCLSTPNPIIRNCLFINNSALRAGGLYCNYSAPTVENCTFYGNRSDFDAGHVQLGFNSPARFESCILAFSASGPAVSGMNGVFTCCDIFGNPGGDWTPNIATQLGVQGNFTADPLFCDELLGDLSLVSSSPCLPGNHPDGATCGLIGAFDQGCPTVPVEGVSWGGVKSLFR